MGLSLPFRIVAWLSERLTQPIERVGPVAARAAMRKDANGYGFVMGPRVEVAQVVDASCAGVQVRRYRPAHAPTDRALVYFHGGGWVVGDLESHDRPCRALAAMNGVEVISVDYRLAPEHPFPSAVDDALAVTRAVCASRRVIVAGDSAGGHLAAVVARHAAAEALPVDGQLLVYPVTDCATEAPSYERFATGHFLTRASMRYYRDQFVRPDQRLHPDASPLHAPALETCPAYVLLAECDVLVDEGRAYAKKLQADGSAVTLDEVAGVTHGFFSLQGLPVTRAAMRRIETWVGHAWRPREPSP